MGVYQLVGLIGINNVGNVPMLECPQVVERVVTHLMPLVNNLLEQFGVFSHVVAHHKESGLGIEVAQCLQDERRGEWVRRRR